jgi:hypothetical protein
MRDGFAWMYFIYRRHLPHLHHKNKSILATNFIQIPLNTEQSPTEDDRYSDNHKILNPYESVPD